jgi:hypothetical protein
VHRRGTWSHRTGLRAGWAVRAALRCRPGRGPCDAQPDLVDFFRQTGGDVHRKGRQLVDGGDELLRGRRGPGPLAAQDAFEHAAVAASVTGDRVGVGGCGAHQAGEVTMALPLFRALLPRRAMNSVVAAAKATGRGTRVVGGVVVGRAEWYAGAHAFASFRSFHPGPWPHAQETASTSLSVVIA